MKSKTCHNVKKFDMTSKHVMTSNSSSWYQKKSKSSSWCEKHYQDVKNFDITSTSLSWCQKYVMKKKSSSSSKGSYIYKRSELRAKRVTSEASINQLGVRRCKHPENFVEFRTPESESECNLTNYFILFLLPFYSEYFGKYLLWL